MVTLLSDFGTRDAYVAQVKARVLSARPDVQLVDITHEVLSYSMIAGGWLVYTSYAYFPAGTIHLAVVDPGVGTGRAVILVRKAGHIFIGPDNGLFSFLYPADEVLEVVWRPPGPISPTFHGRDIFAPVAVQVLMNPTCDGLGTVLENPVTIEVHEPMVVQIDRFGNIVTNIPGPGLSPGSSMRMGKARIEDRAQTYADIPGGGLAMVLGSAGTIEVAMNRASAAEVTGAYVGMPIQLDFPGPHT